MRPPAKLLKNKNKSYKSKIIANLLIYFIVEKKEIKQMCKKNLYRQLIYK